VFSCPRANEWPLGMSTVGKENNLAHSCQRVSRAQKRARTHWGNGPFFGGA